MEDDDKVYDDKSSSEVNQNVESVEEDEKINYDDKSLDINHETKEKEADNSKSCTKRSKRQAATRTRSNIKDLAPCLKIKAKDISYIQKTPCNHGWKYTDWLDAIDDDPYYEVVCIHKSSPTFNCFSSDNAITEPHPDIEESQRTPFSKFVDSLDDLSFQDPHKERLHPIGLLQMFPTADEEMSLDNSQRHQLYGK